MVEPVHRGRVGSDWFEVLQEQNGVRFPDSDDVRVEGFDGEFDDMALNVMRRALASDTPSLLPHEEM
ncbi:MULTISPECIES: hypothetical protein [unclassified Streptomyces]|uniref:hypothetical protein n=1 Tax=unclassified Streptomyces TaxID=2593676 RepID=UPI0013680AD9|nr:hypothetical protein [Streptomyces sp. SID6139]MYR23392.1 hypothetical protein [Streptomyces sp. SID6137]